MKKLKNKSRQPKKFDDSKKFQAQLSLVDMFMSDTWQIILKCYNKNATVLQIHVK